MMSICFSFYQCCTRHTAGDAPPGKNINQNHTRVWGTVGRLPRNFRFHLFITHDDLYHFLKFKSVLGILQHVTHAWLPITDSSFFLLAGVDL